MAGYLLRFEHAVSDNARVYLRLENLLQQVNHFLPGTSPWASRACTAAIFDLLTLVAKPDLKKRLIHEISRILGSLKQLKETAEVDRDKYQNTIEQLDNILSRLNTYTGRFAQELQDDGFLNSVKQASHSASDKNFFDTSNFQYWLQLPAQKRIADLTTWTHHFNDLYSIVRVVLHLIRESSHSEQHAAQNGFYQTTLEKQLPCHLIQVGLPEDSSLYPDINVSGHILSIRFVSLNRPQASNHDVSFNLNCCIL